MGTNTESKETKDLKKKLFREQSRTWDTLSMEERDEVAAYAEEYIGFLNRCRTERQTVKFLKGIAEQFDFLDLDGAQTTGLRWYREVHNKTLLLAVLGKRPVNEGVRLIASHVDTPRLDLKPNPLYEDMGLALLKTHYYGGVKKYQWVARTLALCGTVIRGDGSVLELSIGLEPNDPVLTIPDLLPHLGKKHMEQKASEFIPAENLNVLLGSTPFEDKETEERVKLAVLNLLHTEFNITEEDLTTAELQIVPAEPARHAGIDRSLIAGYGQDDRVCVYTSFTALMETLEPVHTAIAVFYDKEEIGSEGNTSAQSRMLDLFLMDLMERTGITPTSHRLHQIFSRSKAISADVCAAMDPTYPDVFEKRNNARLGFGINITKYTGSGGKYLASDAHAEYAAWVRRLFTANRVTWQAAASGKVDEGGGGTVAKYLAKSGIEIIDAGPPLLGMHSPVEISAKEDVWMCHRAYKAFFGS